MTPRRPAPFRALAAWLVLALAAAAPCLLLLAGKYPLDLDVYRAGARAALDGHEIYAVRLGRYGFTYPPFAAVLFAPLAMVSLAVATVLLTGLSLVALVVVVRLSAPRWLAEIPRPAAVVGVGALLVSEPVRLTLLNGQIELVLAAAVLLDVLVLRRGALVGLAAAVKLTPAVFVLYLLVTGRWREAKTAALTFVAVTAVTAVVLPGESLRYWTSQLLNGAGIGDTARADNMSFWGVLHRVVGPHAATPLWLLLSAAALVVGMSWAARETRHLRGDVAACGVVGVTGCLISPVSWTHHWVWCIPLIAGLARRATGFDRWVLAATAAFFCAYGIPSSLRSHDLPVLSSGYVVWAGVLWCRFGCDWRGGDHLRARAAALLPDQKRAGSVAYADMSSSTSAGFGRPAASRARPDSSRK